MKKKNVLLITYYFPPVGGGGVMRMLKFAKYLPDFDWQPIVLTTSINTLTHDESLLKELQPDTIIYRTRPSFLSNAKFWLLGKTFSQGKILKSQSGKGSKKTSLPLQGFLNLLLEIKKIIESYILLPDEQILWKPSATRLGNNISKKHNIDAIITSGPPHSVHCIGEALSKKLQVPWIVDFRDDWVSNPLFTPISNYGRGRMRELERRIIHQADCLITVTPPLEKKISQRYPDISREKFMTLWNGYDEADFNSIESNFPSEGQNIEYLEIVYVGSYGSQRKGKNLLDALHLIRQNHLDLFTSLRITFVGQFADSKEQWNELLGEQVRFFGSIPHAESIKAMKSADALLLILTGDEDGASAMPGKMYEYMAAHRPIIAITCPGIAREFILAHGYGWVADVNDSNAIYKLLCHIILTWKQQGTLPFEGNTNEIKRFSRRETTKKLADILTRLSVDNSQYEK